MEENNVINSNIGLQIKKEREKKGWTQKDLAEKIFTSQQTISKIERGLMLPSPDKMIDFMKLLGISVYIPPEKMEEKIVTQEIKDTKNCKVFEVRDQYVVLTNSDYLKNDNVLKRFVGQNCAEVLTAPSSSLMDNVFDLFHGDADICKFADIVEKTANISKASKTLLVAFVSFLYHYCSVEMQNFSSVMRLMRTAGIDECDLSHKSKLDYIFDEVEKNDPSSFSVKQYMAFRMEAVHTQKHSIIEINDLFKELEACIESKEEKNWQNTASFDLYQYLKNDEIENKIISVDMEQNKMYGKIIYKYLKYMFKKRRFEAYFDEMEKYDSMKSEAIFNEKGIIDLPKTQNPYLSWSWQRSHSRSNNKQRNRQKFGENEDSLMETTDESWGLENLEFVKEYL